MRRPKARKARASDWKQRERKRQLRWDAAQAALAQRRAESKSKKGPTLKRYRQLQRTSKIVLAANIDWQRIVGAAAEACAETKEAFTLRTTQIAATNVLMKREPVLMTRQQFTDLVRCTAALKDLLVNHLPAEEIPR